MKKLYQEFFRIPREEDGKVRDKVFLARITLSVMIMMACMVVMSLSAYAFFTSSITSESNTIRSANYSLTIEDSSGEIVSESYTCPLVKDDLHIFTLTAEGTAKTGYCKVEITDEQGGKVYYTKQIFTFNDATHPASISLKIRAAKGSVITFISQWGTSVNYTVDQGALYGNEQIIEHSETVYSIHSVAEGDTVAGLANKYGVTAEEICIYNGIEDLAGVEQVKIPGKTFVYEEEVPPEVLPPEEVPPEEVPPEVIPPEVIPPEEVPPEVIPPEEVPPEVIPPEEVPPEVIPPEEVPPEEVPPEVILPEEVPPEVIPPEDIPPEEVPPEEVPPEVIPPEDIPPEEVPPEEVPPEVIPPEDISPEEVPPEEVPPEVIPPEEVPSEDVPPEGVPQASSEIKEQPAVMYTIVWGDSLTSIATLYNTTVERLAAYNRILDIDIIEAGTRILIPPADWEIPTDGVAVADDQAI